MNDPEQAQPGEEQTLHFFLTQPLSVWNAGICLRPGSAPRRNRLAYGSKRIPRTAERRLLLFGGHKTASVAIYFFQYADDKQAFIYLFFHGSGAFLAALAISNRYSAPFSSGPSPFTFKGNICAKFRLKFLPNYL